MSGNQARLNAIAGITNRKPVDVEMPLPLNKIWADDVFNLATMEECLSKSAFKAMKKTVHTQIDHETQQRPAIALLCQRRLVVINHIGFSDCLVETRADWRSFFNYIS